MRAEHKPLATAAPESSTNGTDGKKDATATLPAHLRDNAKWPRRIGITRNNQRFDEAGFYAILYEKPTAFPHLLLAGIIIGVLVRLAYRHECENMLCSAPVCSPYGRSNSKSASGISVSSS